VVNATPWQARKATRKVRNPLFTTKKRIFHPSVASIVKLVMCKSDSGLQIKGKAVKNRNGFSEKRCKNVQNVESME
jgi:hypothetical protein